jgi:glycosyltransferase involved in cell wall biosynthesis
MQNSFELSIIIPLLNEEESILPLFEWILKALQGKVSSLEVIFIDDGSTDGSWEIIQTLAKEHTEVKAISFTKNYGKSQALNAGFKAAKKKYVATLDCDLQDSPEELPKMVQTLRDNNLDLISGWKKKRFDSLLFKNLPSKLFNWAARKVSSIKLHDFNCGIKVYRKKCYKKY